MRTTRADNPCWNCREPNDAISDVEGEKKPKAGDVGMCLACGAPGVFTETLAIRRPTDDEMKQILQDPNVLRYLAAIALTHGARAFKVEKKGD